MRPVEAAEYLRMTTDALARMRVEQRGPCYYKAGGKVLYKIDDLERWVEQRVYQGTGKSTDRDDLER